MNRRASTLLRRAVLLLGLLAALGAVSLGIARWLGLGPYGRNVRGEVIGKTVITEQGAATRVEYVLSVRQANGTVVNVMVPEELYRKVELGWHFERSGGRGRAEAPPGQ